MGYYIDLAGISVDEYREILRSGDLLPSQMVLKEDIDDIFKNIKGQGIENVEQLRIALRSKKKLQEFSIQSGIAEDYLKILIRNVNSYRQKPNKIRDFPGVSERVIQKLESLGLKNTLQLYDRILTPQSRNEIASQTGISENDILRLAKLTDLCRIRWVNHTFSYVLLEAGYDTAGKVANADHQELYERVKKLNEEREIFKGHIGVHDMKLCVEAARALPFEIEY
jgi:uncharacterized protein (UPF0335 family)